MNKWDGVFGPQQTEMLQVMAPRMSPAAIASIPRPAIYADTMYERIVSAIKDFEEGLAADEEVGAKLADFGQAIVISIDDVGFHNPFLIVKTDKPKARRIGYDLEKRLKEEHDEKHEDEEP